MLKNLSFIFFLFLSVNATSQVKDGLVARYSFDYGAMDDEAGSSHPKAYNVLPFTSLIKPLTSEDQNQICNVLLIKSREGSDFFEGYWIGFDKDTYRLQILLFTIHSSSTSISQQLT